VRSGLLQTVMELAGFHQTSSDDGPLSRARMQETESLIHDLSPKHMERTIYDDVLD
jgi:hypothetical protein